MLTPLLNMPTPNATGAPQDAGQGRAGKGEEDGFGKALSSLDNRGSKMSRDTQKSDRVQQSQAEERGQDHNDDEDKTKNRRVSLSPQALIRSVTLRAQSLGVDAGTKTVDPKGKQIAEAQAEAKSLSDEKLEEAKLSGKNAPIKKKDTTSALLDTKARTEKEEDGTGPAEEVAAKPSGNATEPDVKSVLSLLSGQEIQALNQLAQAGAAQKSSNRSETGSEKSGRGAEKLDVQQLAASRAGKDDDAVDALPLPTQGETGGTRTFQFAGQRSGASMEMTIGTASDGRARFEVTRGSNGGGETVTVLDARRFLGFNLSQNGAALTSAMTNQPDWTSAMHPSAALSNAAAQSSTGHVVNTLKLQMTPHDLGTVTATLKLTGDQLTVHLTVENRAAQNQLSQDSSGILDALRSQGFTVDQVTVSITPSSQSDASSQGGDSGQRGPALGQQGNGSGGQGQSGRSGSSFSSGMESNDHVSDTRVAASGGDARSDDIYL